MNKNDFLEYCKYYKGETEPPNNFNDVQKLWWSGEKQFIEEAKDPKFISRWKGLYKEALKAGQIDGKLIDFNYKETQRLIIFYLDLWHGKWFPYDNLDLINEY